MQSTDQALHAKSRLPWVLTALMLAVAVFGAVAPAGYAQQRQEDFAGWGNYQAKGWSAGAVARGTGYQRPGASLRVREVQRRLNRLGYGAGRVDGLFGPITETAVRRYQGDHALRLDGIVGPQTLEDLRSRTRRGEGVTDQPIARRGRSATGNRTSRSTRAPAASEEAGSDGAVKQDVLLSAALIAILLAALVLARGRIREAAARFRTRVRRADPHAAGDLYPTAYVEGRSADEGIGAFRGFVYTARPMGGEEETASLLVYDPSKPKPVYARPWEITAINGRAVRPAGPPRRVREETARERVPRRQPQTGGVGASVTPLSSRRMQSPAPLRIVRRIEAPPASEARSGGGPASVRMSERHRGRLPNRFRWIGARVHLADAEGVEPMPGILTIPVELELFAESEFRRWETGLLDTEQALHVAIGDLEADVRAVVVPDRISQLAEALAEAGVLIDTDELARLPFAVERSIEVERAIAGMEWYSIRAS